MDTVKAGVGGALDANPVSFPYLSNEVTTYQTLGTIKESLTILSLKSSVISMTALWIPENAWVDQSVGAPTTGMWCRASPFMGPSPITAHRAGAVSWRDDQANRYDTRITWLAVTIGQVQFSGAGNERPDYTEDNCHALFHDYCVYFGRSTVTELGRLAISPFTERTHPFVHKNTYTKHGDELLNGGHAYETTWFEIYYWKTLGAIYRRSGEPSPIDFNIPYSSGALALYSSDVYRYRNTNAYIGLDDDISVMKAHQKLINMPGLQFIFAVNFGPLPSMKNILQGIDTERFPIILKWTRAQPINTTVLRDMMGESGIYGQPGDSYYFQMYDQNLLCLVTVNYQGIATINRGLLSVSDCWHFYGHSVGCWKYRRWDGNGRNVWWRCWGLTSIWWWACNDPR